VRSPLLEETLESIAANVRRLRALREVTQEQLCEQARLDLSYVQRVERASVNLSAGVLVALAEALGVRPAALLRPARLGPLRRGRPSKRSKRART